jgi:hypothetical protein
LKFISESMRRKQKPHVVEQGMCQVACRRAATTYCSSSVSTELSRGLLPRAKQLANYCCYSNLQDKIKPILSAQYGGLRQTTP